MGSPSGDRPTLRDLVNEAGAELEAAGIDGAALDARILVCAAAGIDHAGLIGRGEQPVSDEVRRMVDAFVGRRRRREPVSRIVGRREFWSLDFDVNDATLDPRADTETVVRAALDVAATLPGRDGALRLCDLGTGTGCILLALLHELPGATGVGVDISPAALEVATGNASRLGLGERASFVCGNWTAPLTGRFDLIVSNPPYVRSGEIGDLEPEVRDHDPSGALDGGPDGLEAYRHIVAGAHRFLAPGGWLVLEIGHDQNEGVKGLLKAGGYVLDGRAPALVRDLAGRPRCLRAAVP